MTKIEYTQYGNLVHRKLTYCQWECKFLAVFAKAKHIQILLLGVYPSEMCTSVHLKTLLIIASSWKLPKVSVNIEGKINRGL